MSDVEKVDAASRLRRRLAVGTRLRRARAFAVQVRDRHEGVHTRLRALEDEVQEQRQLNRRIAELTDVVAELLVPVADRDTELVREVLDQYRKELV